MKGFAFTPHKISHNVCGEFLGRPPTFFACQGPKNHLFSSFNRFEGILVFLVQSLLMLFFIFDY